jgi:hypothetical protein
MFTPRSIKLREFIKEKTHTHTHEHGDLYVTEVSVLIESKAMDV